MGAFRGGGGYGFTNLSLGKLPNGWTVWHQIRPTIPHDGILGGGVRGSTIQKPGKCGQTAGPIGNTFCTYNAGESGMDTG